jgi:hypothetical protein
MASTFLIGGRPAPAKLVLSRISHHLRNGLSAAVTGVGGVGIVLFYSPMALVDFDGLRGGTP